MHTVETFVNGPTTSLAFGYSGQYYQLDFHKCTSPGEYEASSFYLAYGDLGGILGRLTDYAGFKYGTDGLWLYYHPEGKVEANSTRIDLTTNPEAICKFLGLKYQVYANGFRNIQEIFDWVCESRFYFSDIFDFEKLNSDHRRRATKRPMYINFVQYTSQKSKLFSGLGLTRGQYIMQTQMECIKYFGKLAEFEEKQAKLERHAAIREKFSGKLFVELKINPKSIGKLTEQFKEFIGEQFGNFDEWVLSSEQELIKKELSDWVKSKELELIEKSSE